ncbi:hypothetical protein TREES_T100001554 [Tupaia chinensis]|uniref:Uncharacterized protein n=1 Tax=Tupaia chinensis TaxID=246437 RepID=L9KN15_TUPCH|nr:hypothetical protein TREES_T100001554 [Tupaia chinensis]
MAMTNLTELHAGSVLFAGIANPYLSSRVGLHRVPAHLELPHMLTLGRIISTLHWHLRRGELEQTRFKKPELMLPLGFGVHSRRALPETRALCLEGPGSGHQHCHLLDSRSTEHDLCATETTLQPCGGRDERGEHCWPFKR